MNCARCETRPMIRTEALQPAAHVITAKHMCPARHTALAYPGFPSICYSNPKFRMDDPHQEGWDTDIPIVTVAKVLKGQSLDFHRTLFPGNPSGVRP